MKKHCGGVRRCFIFGIMSNLSSSATQRVNLGLYGKTAAVCLPTLRDGWKKPLATACFAWMTFPSWIHDKIGHTVSGSILQLEAAMLVMNKHPDQPKQTLETAAGSARNFLLLPPARRILVSRFLVPFGS